MIKSILEDVGFFCFIFIMESAVVTIFNMILSATLFFYDFVGVY